jgi:peptide/nickel transport system ATP-binding protein
MICGWSITRRQLPVPVPRSAVGRGTAAGRAARALVVEPDLLVCDEVTSALDVSVQAVIVELLRTIQAQRHLAMIFITHNLALVRSVAQFAVVLRQGEIADSRRELTL